MRELQKQLQEQLKYFKKQQRAMTARGGDPEAYAPRIQKIEEELKKIGGK